MAARLERTEARLTAALRRLQQKEGALQTEKRTVARFRELGRQMQTQLHRVTEVSHSVDISTLCFCQQEIAIMTGLQQTSLPDCLLRHHATVLHASLSILVLACRTTRSYATRSACTRSGSAACKATTSTG
jgi:hypothetical protein